MLSLCHNLSPHGYSTGTCTYNLSLQVDPTKGTVGFGSGLHGWAFTMKQFAEFYSAKFKIEPAKLMKRLWGDQFYNAKEKKWAKSYSDGYVRGFNQFILDPIYKVFIMIYYICRQVRQQTPQTLVTHFLKQTSGF